MSGAPEDSADNARLDALLRAMRAYQGGEASARAPIAPGESGRDAELCRLFNAIVERSALLERRLAQQAGTGGAQREDATAAASATHGRVTVVGTRSSAIAVFEDVSAAETLGAMGEAAKAAVHGLGGAWERAVILRIRSDEDVRTALAGHDIVCALFDARSPLEPLLSAARALEAAVPDAPMVYFAPEGDHASADRAAAAARGRDGSEVVRSIGQASERLTLHWLTKASGADELSVQQPDPGYGLQRFEGEKVLVVDDDVRNVFAMVSALELYGLTALTADSGYAAIEILDHTQDVSLVLMDLMMPGLDGYATTARIRERAAFSTLPIIAVTARSGASDRERSLAAGLTEYVTKPVEVEHMLGLIRSLI
ncbi:response regulator [Actinospica sp.]|uniref:response regulator n=1 Tax=Actinospica sp. TaxID=1872142 RepID=UPI002CBFB6F6|nr:response regulator [Actinospica sp.]HWG23675.1 response regulator [Actinospica sp.]